MEEKKVKCPMCGEESSGRETCPKCHSLLPAEVDETDEQKRDVWKRRFFAVFVANVAITLVLVVLVGLLLKWTIPSEKYKGDYLYIGSSFAGTIVSTTDLPGGRIRVCYVKDYWTDNGTRRLTTVCEVYESDITIRPVD